MLQNSIDFVTARADNVANNGYTANPYKTPDLAIQELCSKYENKSDWGCGITSNIVDTRAAFIIGQGIQVKLKEGYETIGERELEFIDNFIKENNLDEEMPQEYAKEAELEGKWLGVLSWDESKKQVKLRYVSYNQTKYKVTSADDDYAEYTQASYKLNGQDTDKTYAANEFVYKKFSGRTNKVNEVTPKLAKTLGWVEDIDKALWGWRKMNRFFASPTPYFECEDTEEANSFYEMLKKVRWNVGKFLAGTAKYSLVTPETGGMESLKEEILAKAKMVSGTSGVPVHFLGLPDLMSNRAVSTDLFEAINASTSKEKSVWVGAYEEIFDKAIEMNNTKNNGNLMKGILEVSIPQVTSIKLQELTDVWLPMYLGGAIDLGTMLAQVPNIDATKVKKNIEEMNDLDARASKLLGVDNDEDDI